MGKVIREDKALYYVWTGPLKPLKKRKVWMGPLYYAGTPQELWRLLLVDFGLHEKLGICCVTKEGVKTYSPEDKSVFVEEKFPSVDGRYVVVSTVSWTEGEDGDDQYHRVVKLVSEEEFEEVFKKHKKQYRKVHPQDVVEAAAAAERAACGGEGMYVTPRFSMEMFRASQWNLHQAMMFKEITARNGFIIKFVKEHESTNTAVWTFDGYVENAHRYVFDYGKFYHDESPLVLTILPGGGFEDADVCTAKTDGDNALITYVYRQTISAADVEKRRQAFVAKFEQEKQEKKAEPKKVEELEETKNEWIAAMDKFVHRDRPIEPASKSQKLDEKEEEEYYPLVQTWCHSFNPSYKRSATWSFVNPNPDIFDEDAKADFKETCHRMWEIDGKSGKGGALKNIQQGEEEIKAGKVANVANHGHEDEDFGKYIRYCSRAADINKKIHLGSPEALMSLLVNDEALREEMQIHGLFDKIITTKTEDGRQVEVRELGFNTTWSEGPEGNKKTGVKPFNFDLNMGHYVLYYKVGWFSMASIVPWEQFKQDRMPAELLKCEDHPAWQEAKAKIQN